MREKVIEAYLGQQVKKVGGASLKWTGSPGYPDRVVMMPGGRVAFVELKAPCGVLSPLQKLIHKRVRAMGCNIWVLRTKAQVDEFLAIMLASPSRGWVVPLHLSGVENEIAGLQVVRGAGQVGQGKGRGHHGEGTSSSTGGDPYEW
jgi:hypothetical protein